MSMLVPIKIDFSSRIAALRSLGLAAGVPSNLLPSSNAAIGDIECLRWINLQRIALSLPALPGLDYNGFVKAISDIANSIPAVTLDPAKLSHGTLSNGNLTLAGNSASNYGYALSTTAHSTGKWHFEFTNINESTDTNFAFGFAASLPVSGPGSSTTDIAGFNDTLNTVFFWNNTIVGTVTGVTFAAGQTVAVEVDFDLQLVWLQNITANPGKWNGNTTANPATGVGGFSFAGKLASGVPYYMLLNVNGLGFSGSAKFAAPFALTPSTGFNAW